MSILEKIENALDDLTHLEIRTIVGEFTEEQGTGKIAAAPGAAKISTRIGLIDGDIVTGIDPSFLQDDRKSIRDFHEKREAQGHQVIKDNIAALRELMALFIDVENRKKDGG